MQRIWALLLVLTLSFTTFHHRELNAGRGGAAIFGVCTGACAAVLALVAFVDQLVFHGSGRARVLRFFYPPHSPWQTPSLANALPPPPSSPSATPTFTVVTPHVVCDLSDPTGSRSPSAEVADGLSNSESDDDDDDGSSTLSASTLESSMIIVTEADASDGVEPDDDATRQ